MKQKFLLLAGLAVAFALSACDNAADDEVRRIPPAGDGGNQPANMSPTPQPTPMNSPGTM